MKITRIKNMPIPTNFYKNALRKFWLILLLVVNLDAFGATYYLTSAGASAASTPGSWNTVAGGGGTALASWTTASTNDTYIIPIGVNGVWATSVTIGNSGTGAQSFTFVVDGTMNVDDNITLTLDGSKNVITWTINGTLSIDETTGYTFISSNIDYAYFKFSSGSTLISNNFVGIEGSVNCIFDSSNELVYLFNPGTNYVFTNTTNATNFFGLNDTINNLTISTTGFISTLQSNLLVNGTLSITAGTLAVAANTLTLGASATFTHSTGAFTLSTGNFVINGTYTHSSGAFTISTGSVTVGATGTLALNSGVFNMAARTLTIAGTVTRTSGSIHFTAASGTVAFTNTTAKTLPSNMFLRYPANFTLNGAGGISLGGNTRTAATDSLGVVTFTSGNLTLTSGITAIGSIAGSGGNIVGNATATLTFYGAATNTLRMDQTTPGTTNAVSVLNVNGTSNVTLGTNFEVLTTLTLNARTLAIGTFTLTLGPSATFTHSAGTVSLGAAGSFVINGIYTHSSGTFTISTGSVTVGSTGTLALNSGVFNMAARTLTIAGTVTRTSGSIHFTAGSGTVAFTNTTAKTLPSNMFLRYPANFTLNGAGGITLGGNTRTAVTDSLGAVTFTSGNLTLTSGITAIGSISGSGGNIVGNATATLSFYGATTNTLLMSQTSPGTTNALNVLILNGTANLTLGSNLNVNTTLTLNSRTLNLGSFTLTKTGTFTNGTATIQLSTGTLSVSGAYTHVNTGILTFGSGTLAVGSLVMTSGNINVSTGFLNIGGAVSRTTGQIFAPVGTVTFTNTTSITLPINTFISYPTNFRLNGIGGVTLGGNTRTAATDSIGILTFTSGNLTLTTGTTTILAIVGSGGNIVGNASATLVLHGSTTNTLYMNQTTPGTSNAVSVLTLNQSTNLTLGSNLDVKTTLTLNSRTLNLGSFTLTKTGTFTNGTATIQLSTGTLSVSGAYTHVNTGTVTFGSGTLAVGSLVMTSGNINVSTGILSIGGAVSRTSGQIHAPSGTVRFTNTSAVTLPSNTFITYPSNFTLNGTGGVILGSNSRPAATDSLATVTFTSGNLTLTSGITAISSISGSGGNIVGNATATLTFYGAATNTLRMDQTTPGTTNAVSVLNVNGTSNVTLGSNFDVLTTLTLNARTLAIDANTLTLGPSATFTNSTGTVTISTGNFVINGIYTHSSGTFTITSTASVTVGSTGTLALNSGVFNMLARTLTIAGTVTRTSGSIHFTAASGTVSFTNTSAKTLPSNMFLRYPANFTLNGVGGITLGGNTRTAVTDSLGAVTFTSGNLTLTLGITAIGSISGSGGNIVGNATATLSFYGATTNTLLMSQTSPGTTNALNVLILNGTANLTLGSNLNVNTTLTLNARTLNLGSFTLTKTGTFTNGTATIQLSTGTLSVSGAYTHVNTGTLTFGSGTLAVGSLTMTSGNINVSTGILSIGGAVSRTTGQIHAPSGTVRFTNTSSVTLPSNTFITYPSNFTLNGTGGVILGSNSRPAATDSLVTVTFTSGNLTLTTGITTISTISGSGGNIIGNASATLVFYGSSTNTLLMNQTTPGTSNAVNVLTLNGTSNVTLGSNFDVKTTLTLNSRTLNLGSFTLTKTGTFTNGTATVQLSSGTLSVSGAYTHVNTGTLTFGSGTLSVGSLTMTSGNINVSSGTLSIAGAVSRTSGQIHAPSGTVRFTNTSSVTLPSNTFVTYPANFTLNGAGGVILGGKTGTLKDSLGNLTFTSGNLTVTTDTTCIGSITGSGGNVVSNASASIRFYGSSSSTLRTSQTSPGTSNTIKNVLLTGTSSVTLGNALRVTPNGLVNIPTGTTFTTGGNLTLTSTSSGNGRIGNVVGTLNSSSTDSIQIYAEGNYRGFRLFGNPFTSALALSQFTDNATEIDITGTGGSGNGFTTTLNNKPSAFTYSTSADSFQAYTAISQTIGVGNGAYIMVRGTRGQGLNGSAYTPNATTIRLAGQFNSGSINKSLSNANYGWNLIANPYPSNIDLDLVSNGDWAGIDLTIYGYDKRNKAFSVYTKGTNGSNKVNNISNIIQMGSSFFVQAISPVANCTFRENTKTDLSSTVSSNPIFTQVDELKDRFKMSLTGIVTGDTLTDECLLSFGNREQASEEYEENRDAWDLGGEELTIGIVTPLENILAINEYPALSEIKSPIGLHVWVRQPGTYKLNFRDIAPMDWKIQVWLRDKYTNTVTHIQQKGEYEFVVNEAPESQGTQRFELFTMKNVTGTEELTGNAQLKIFPNPINSSTQSIDLLLAGEGHGQVAVKIIDMMGREIYNAGHQIHIPNQAIQIIIPRNLIPQTYILVCESNKGMFQQQISINNQ